MNELKDYQSILSDKARRIETLFKKYPDAAELARDFANINATKIRKTEPEIMVYGIYNAGKSSILNELIGEDKAKVEDKPTTDTVTYYDWQSYKIADTPGVFAPIEHEEVTEAHLKKADIVLFVMSTTGSNEKIENYTRMKKIVDDDKKIIIVLNDKNGDLGTRDGNILEIKRKVVANMDKVGIDGKKYSIVTVNAARARKGRTENKPRLLEKSGLDELKDVILTELKRTSSFEILRGGISRLENILDEFIRKLEGKENSDALRKINQVLETFKRQKISMRSQINTFIETRTESFGDVLPQIIWANRDKQNQLEEILDKEVEDLSASVQREIKNRLQDAADILDLEIKSFADKKIYSSGVDAESFKKILARLDEVKNQSIQTPDSKSDNDTIFDPATFDISRQLAKTAIGKSISSIVRLPIPPEILIRIAIEVLKKIFGNDDERKKLEERIAAKNEQERRRVEAEMQARQDLNQRCRYSALKLADELKVAADNIVKEILAKYEEPFNAEIKERNAEGAQVAKDILTLRELYNEYDLLRVDLGGR